MTTPHASPANTDALASAGQPVKSEISTPPPLIMSTNTSPPHPNHLIPPVFHTPITATASSHHIPSSAPTSSSHHISSAPATFPDGSGFSSTDLNADDDHVGSAGSIDSPSTHAHTGKAKNGATGPADGKSKPHLCHICGRGFTTGGHLQRHQRIHSGVKAFRCPFPGCETRTSRQDNLQQHYRTHLSPTLRRGSGSAARAAVNAAMEAAGLKSSTTRAPRKSKGSTTGTPSSASAAGSTSHLPSPYQTPTSGPSPYAPYMYDPTQHGGYPGYPPLPPPPLPMGQAQSANSSRVPSPVNGHGPAHPALPPPIMTGPPHHAAPQFYPPPFSPYGYPGHIPPHQPYRPFPGVSPYSAVPPPHLYSPGVAPEHGHQPMFSPMNTAFPNHSREGSYSGVLTPGGYQIPNGYPPRTQTSTPISGAHDEIKQESAGGYGRPPHFRPTSPGRRRTPPPPDMFSHGLVDPANMHRPGMQHTIQPSYTYQPPHAMSGNYYSTPQSAQTLSRPPMAASTSGHRASVSSLSDGSGHAADGAAKANPA